MTSWFWTFIVALADLAVVDVLGNSLNVGAGVEGSLDTTSRWATNTSRITIRIGNAALLRNLFSLAPPPGLEDRGTARPRVQSPRIDDRAR